MREPWLIARRWVRQRHVSRSVLPPSANRGGQRLLEAAAQKVALSILADEQSQFNSGQPGEQLFEPQRRTLELIGEAVPGTRRIAVLVDATTGPWQLTAIKAAAEKLRIELHVLEIRSSQELDHALEAGVKGGARALVQLSSPLFDLPLLTKRIVDFTAKHRLPAISMFRRFAEAGGLMSYGPNGPEYYKRLPVYIDKILKGGKPAAIPIEQPTKFDFVINLKAAKALGLKIPQSLLLQADQVIE